MHATEWHDLVNCAACGAVVAPGADRACAIYEDAFLCWDCAIRRGAEYDLADDRWTVMPDVSDLAPILRPH